MSRRFILTVLLPLALAFGIGSCALSTSPVDSPPLQDKSIVKGRWPTVGGEKSDL